MVKTGIEKAKSFINSVVNFFKTLPSKASTWLTNTIQKVISWGKNLVTKGKQAATDFLNTIVNKLKAIPGKVVSIGKNIVEGIWNGIKKGKDWLVGKVKSFASGIVDGIKDALKIKSPSRVMIKLAKFIPMGIGVGIQRNMNYALKAIQNVGSKITKKASEFSPTIATKFEGIKTKVKAFGKGGTVTSPQFAVVGDTKETIVPHGNTPRNRALLDEAARGVGVKKTPAQFNITFAPVINGGSASENKAMLEGEFERFKQMMDEYLAEKGALAY